MTNFDPTEPLVDLRVLPGEDKPTFVLEPPQLSCPCDRTGWLGNEWLYNREPECDCPSMTSDFSDLHSLSCDSVPCPFCPLETP